MEPGSGALVIISRLTIVECVAALERKARAGELAEVDRDLALQSFNADLGNRLLVLECDDAVIRTACSVARRQQLKAGDCVQLATALHAMSLCSPLERTQMVLLSADAALNAAAQREGLPARDPTDV